MVSELGFSDALSLAQTIGIVGTMVLTLYFSKRQIQGLSIDVETKVLNDLGEKVHRMGEMLVERPTLGRVITNTQTGMWSEEIPFAYYVLYICSYAYSGPVKSKNGINHCFCTLYEYAPCHPYQIECASTGVTPTRTT